MKYYKKHSQFTFGGFIYRIEPSGAVYRKDFDGWVRTILKYNDLNNNVYFSKITKEDVMLEML